MIVEKPFGTDLASAQRVECQSCERRFPEEDTYRIDHYLGKETAQNIMVLRFANAIFEPLWNTRYIDHVQITAAETLGVEGRAGVLRRRGRVARHGAEPSAPTALPRRRWSRRPISSADSIRDEKVKVVRSLRPHDRTKRSRQNVVRGAIRRGRDQRQAGAGLSRRRNA